MTGPIDGHAHLNELAALDRCLHDARQAGVQAIIGVGMDIPSNRRILAIAAANEGFVFPAVGYHPWEIRKDAVEETLAFIDENLGGCVALGEVGLDYKAKVKKKLQRHVFGELLRLALRHGKVPILHCRYSHERVFTMVTEAGVDRAVFHWYTGTIDLMRRIIDAGYCISATPALRYSPPHREAVRAAPMDGILIETDCPVAYQGVESRPVDVVDTAREVARLKGMDPAEVMAVTAENTKNLYSLPGLL